MKLAVSIRILPSFSPANPDINWLTAYIMRKPLIVSCIVP
ncbi:Uncharacterised protein [Klebsiella pneumoniae]|nr:Uncharacterised protein [Klebsiella pneumoniae]